MNSVFLLLFLVTAGLNAVAQLLLKRGSMDLAAISAEAPTMFMRVVKIVANPFVFTAVATLGVGMLLWIWLISKMELSRAYPVNIALTIIITSVFSFLLFGESLTFTKLAGTGLIVAGIWLLLLNV